MREPERGQIEAVRSGESLGTGRRVTIAETRRYCCDAGAIRYNAFEESSGAAVG